MTSSWRSTHIPSLTITHSPRLCMHFDPPQSPLSSLPKSSSRSHPYPWALYPGRGEQSVPLPPTTTTTTTTPGHHSPPPPPGAHHPQPPSTSGHPGQGLLPKWRLPQYMWMSSRRKTAMETPPTCLFTIGGKETPRKRRFPPPVLQVMHNLRPSSGR